MSARCPPDGQGWRSWGWRRPLLPLLDRQRRLASALAHVLYAQYVEIAIRCLKDVVHLDPHLGGHAVHALPAHGDARGIKCPSQFLERYLVTELPCLH